MQLSQYAESLYVKIDCPYCTVEAVGVHKKIKKHHNAPGYLGRRICRFSIYENGLPQMWCTNLYIRWILNTVHCTLYTKEMCNSLSASYTEYYILLMADNKHFIQVIAGGHIASFIFLSTNNI